MLEYRQDMWKKDLRETRGCQFLSQIALERSSLGFGWIIFG
jgi:hypothetical protein